MFGIRLQVLALQHDPEPPNQEPSNQNPIIALGWKFRKALLKPLREMPVKARQWPSLQRPGRHLPFIAQQLKRQKESPRLGRLLLLYVDDAYDGATPFGKVRRRAFKIMPSEKLQLVGQRMSTKPSSQLTLRWVNRPGYRGGLLA